MQNSINSPYKVYYERIFEAPKVANTPKPELSGITPEGEADTTSTPYDWRNEENADTFSRLVWGFIEENN